VSQKIFLNLPVSDLAASKRFLGSLGATNEPKFSDDTGVCMVLSDSIFFMLLTHDKYRQFTPLPVGDAKAYSTGLIALSRSDRDHVDQSIDAAVAAGGTADPAPKQDFSFMYGRSVADPDGHHYELFWMDPAAGETDAAAIEVASANSQKDTERAS
jgi:predicted lactoylglutathione lyase